MEYTFSQRSKNLKPSAIREIFKYAADPSYISLSAGNPAPEAFPFQAIQRISGELLQNDPTAALQYSVTEGYPKLREQLKEYMHSQQTGGKNDDLIITSGAQQVMDLAAKALLNEGDIVLCEAPSFIGSLNTFRSYNAKLIGIPVEHDGMDMEQLETALQTSQNVRFIYTIPTFQNPSGVTMCLEKRKQLYALAKRYNVLILEDNPYGELYYNGAVPPTIKSMDTEGIVIYAGSFSKIISPGIRVGWCLAPKQIIQKLVVCKQGSDVHTNIWAQILCSKFIEQYDFSRHLQFSRDLYSKKAKATETLLKQYTAPELNWNPIEGGLFAWCTLPATVPMADYVQKALTEKVCVVPGNAFLTDETQESRSFRINFTTPTDEQVAQGIQILGTLIKKY